MFDEYLPIKIYNDHAILNIKVTPKASKNRIGKVLNDPKLGNILKVYVTSPPENNKANTAVIEMLSDILKIPKSSITIISGHTSTNKSIKIVGDNITLKGCVNLIVSLIS